LAEHFIERLSGLEGDGKDSESVQAVLAGLRSVRALMGTSEEQSLTSESVQKIHGIRAGIVNQIVPR